MISVIVRAMRSEGTPYRLTCKASRANWPCRFQRCSSAVTNTEDVKAQGRFEKVLHVTRMSQFGGSLTKSCFLARGTKMNLRYLICIFFCGFISQVNATALKMSPDFCSRAKSLSQGFAEGISRHFEVPLSSVTLVRADSLGRECDIRVDTSKGLIRCDFSTEVYFDGKKDYWIHGLGNFCRR